MSPFLMVKGVSMVFGGLSALDDVEFSLEKGQILGLVGPNGSGKSTLLNILSGVYKPASGSVVHRGTVLTGLSPSAIAATGLARTFQNLQIFHGLSVEENVLVGRTCRMRSTVLGCVFGLPFARKEEEEARARASSLLRLVGLERFGGASPSTLSYGQRRLLEVARALASEPSVLMLDEPCAGLAQSETEELASLIRTLGASGIGVIVIEHNMRFVMGLVDRIVALNFGRKIAEGDPASIRENEAVIAAYLGRKSHAGR
jgi:branched-chain amino acid transport system ATP-binding protein